ncbi:MAG: ATP-dependent DNA helicase PcrA [Chlamydiae bacterium]|nr:ATP-dependent DNA helicase PcrA [Chlamydiota bacterium]
MTKALLNPQQQEAAQHMSGPLLVLAGAGSGKTRVITCRIAELLEKGVDPRQIIAVTFTNKAAVEMRERIQKEVPKAPLICTFHSLGVRILRESIHHLGYKNHFLIYDEEDALKILRTCIKSIGIEDKKITPKALKQVISRAKNHLQEPDPNDDASPVLQVAPKVYQLYQLKLFEASAVDFDDLLYLPVKLFREFPKVLEMYQDRWHQVLIDEYQDTNMAQYVLASLLVQKRKNLFVVGDPDQSIYTWRGANIENILNFEKDWPDAKIIRLEQNYRSTSNILKAANHLVECNQSRYKKDLWSDLGEGEKIHSYRAFNEREEAFYIIEEIVKLRKTKSLSLKDMVIFYRTNAQSRPFEDELLKRNIPYKILGAMSFYQRKEIKDILAFLRLIENSADLVSFLRTIHLPKRGIGEATLTKIIALSHNRQETILATCDHLTKPEASMKLSQKQLTGLKEYLTLLAELKKIKAESPLQELVYQTVQKTGYLGILKLDPDSYEDRKGNIDELIGKAIEWEEQVDAPSLSKFLEELTLNTSEDYSDTSIERMSLMSFHNGKGLEFHTVFMSGMEETLFPHINCLNTDQGIEEERRLCYVGMTRAKRALYLSHTTTRFVWGGPRSMRPSRFLREIPKEYFESKDEEIEFIEPTPQSEKEFSEFLEGNRVFHHDFGAGVIRKVGSSSLGVTYDVFFQKDGKTKTLLAKYAKLKSLN